MATDADLGPLRSAISPLELDGYLTGVIVTPQPAPISPSTWIMQLWGPPIFDDDTQIKTVLGALIKRYNALGTKIDRSVKLLQAEGAVDYQPAFLAGDKKPTHDSVRTWVRGFWRAMTLAPEAWSSLVEDERTQILIGPFVGFFDLEPHDPDALPHNRDALLDEDAALIPRMILVLRKLAHIRQTDGFVSRRSHRGKIGRNEPCPCGSGRKYKRCCAILERGSMVTFDNCSPSNKSADAREERDWQSA
jgi:uncharacterized protein